MARYLNIYPQKNVVTRKAYDGDNYDWICEHNYMVAIETDDGRLIEIPVMDTGYLRNYTADEYLKEYVDENIRIIMTDDCPARDSLIKEKITEWVCNEGCIDGCGITEAICRVVAMLAKSGMWKEEYGKCIDVKKIKEEWGEE